MTSSIARTIDHAVLHPAQTDADLREACRMGMALEVATICVKPYMVPLAAELLASAPVGVSTVIGFPHGSAPTGIKVAEATWAGKHGATELDMVVNLGHVIGGDWDQVAADIRAVVAAGHEQEAATKVIFETGLLPDDAAKIRLCEISEQAGAAFVKTSTGFGFVKQPDGSVRATGATEHDVQLLRRHCSERVGVKASGGVRTYAAAVRMVQLGATRLGTSSTEAIVREEQGLAPLS